MDKTKKRLTLDIDAGLQRRLKSVAALKGVSMRAYCQAAIEKQVEQDEGYRVPPLPFGQEAVDRLRGLQSRISKGRVLSDSTELIRAARKERSATQ